MGLGSTSISREAERDRQIIEVIEDLLLRRAGGEVVSDRSVLESHPDLMPELVDSLEALQRVESAHAAACSADTTTPPPNDALPVDVFPGYELLTGIHRGGQGVVYRALQTATNREVGIKVMHEGPFVGSRGKARFDREIRTLARLKHPNIVTIHDSGIAAGHHYFVMDYISGVPLDVYIESQRGSVRDTLRLFATLCAAVNAAHLNGIIHRDIKPGNILIDQHGEPQILDFGLAKSETDDAPASRTMTITGQFVGSLPWASPEQADGRPERIDLRTDVYSLGVVLYHALTGRFPYEVNGKMGDILHNIAEEEPARPATLRPEIDGEVETIVLKCLAKEPDRRYQNAGELSRDIERYLAGEPIDAKRDSTLYILRKQLRRYRAPLAAMTAFVVLLVVSSVVAWMLYVESQNNLRQSYLGNARALREGGQVGRRFDALEALAKAAAIQPSIELRSEAIAAMALTDVRLRGEWTQLPLGAMVSFDDRLARCAIWKKSGSLRVVRRADGAELMNLPDAFPYASLVVFSPGGKLVARGSRSNCEVWDVERQSLICTIPAQVAFQESLRFDPRGTRLGIGTMSGDVLILDSSTLETRTLHTTHTPVASLAFHPTDELLATSSTQGGDVFVREIQTGKVRGRYTCSGPASLVSWSPDGRLLAAAGRSASDYSVFVWDLDAATSFTLKRHTNAGIQLGFSPASDLLVTSAWDGMTHFWDPRTGTHLLSQRGGWLGTAAHESYFISARGSHRRAFGRMEVVHEREFRSIVATTKKDASRGGGESVAIHPSGKLAISCCQGGVRFWDLVAGAERAFLPLGQTQDVCFSPAGDQMFVVVPSGVSMWPIREAGNTLTVGPPIELVSDRSWTLWRGILSQDGTRLVVSIDRRNVLVIDTNTGDVLHKLPGHTNVAFVAMNPTNDLVAAGAWQGTGVSVWDLQDGATRRDLDVPAEAEVAFSPDGRWLVTSSADIVIWDTRTLEPVARFPMEQFGGVPGPIAFSADGTLLAVGAGGGPIVLIEMASLRFTATLTPPNAFGMAHLAFSPDSSRLFYPHPNGEVLYMWELRLVREELAKINLDWDLPPYPPTTPCDTDKPLRVEVDLGELASSP